MWKKATLSVLGILLVAGVGKAAYSRGYKRGLKEGKIELARVYVDSPRKFLSEAELWCTVDAVEGLETVATYRRGNEEAKQKFVGAFMENCRTKVRAAAVNLVGRPE